MGRHADAPEVFHRARAVGIRGGVLAGAGLRIEDFHTQALLPERRRQKQTHGASAHDQYIAIHRHRLLMLIFVTSVTTC